MFSLTVLTFIFIVNKANSLEQSKYKLNNVTDFIELVTAPGFVDTSLFMKYIFDGDKNKVITAPRSFTKTANMDMLRIFLSLPENISVADRYVNVEVARQMFQGLEIYKQKEEFFNDYFAKYPVVYIDFRVAETANISSYDEAMKVIQDKTHEWFKNYKDLCTSVKLLRSERIICNLYTDEEEYTTLWLYDYTHMLQRMCTFLYKHYDKKKVVVIVDDFDSVMNNAMFNSDRETLDNITSTFKKIFSYILEDNEYTERVIMTGRSHVIGGFLAETNDVRFYTFLEDHNFVEYFGFEVSKLDKTLVKCNVEESVIDRMRHKFYAYTSKSGVRLYSPVSILSTLHFGMVKNFWTKEWYIEGLREIYKDMGQREHLQTFIRRLLDDECLDIKLIVPTSRNVLLGLQSLFDEKLIAKPEEIRSLFFTYLFEQGYLCFPGDGRSCVKVPNKEIQKELFVISGIRHYQIH